MVTAQRALGHTSATTTLNANAHLWPAAEVRTRNAVEAMFIEALGEGAGNSADYMRTNEVR